MSLGHRTFLVIHAEFESLLDEPLHAPSHPLSRALTVHIDVAVIRIADEAVSPALQFPIELVQEDVGQKWEDLPSERSG